MERETISYIINYFSNLMTKNEKLALKSHMYVTKSSDNKYLRRIMLEKGWINNDPETSHLLKNGYEAFELGIVKRIMSETPEKVFFNNCPKCEKLARTPYAKQCRYCGYSWHSEQKN